MALNRNILVGRFPGDIQALAEQVGLLLGHPMERRTDVDGILFQTSCIGLDIRIFPCEDYEDNLGIEFGRYQYIIDVVSFRLKIGVQYSEERASCICLFLGSWLSIENDCECQLLEDLQRKVARFDPPTG